MNTQHTTRRGVRRTQAGATSSGSWLECACPFGGASASVRGGSLLGNHHPPRESMGVPRPVVATRWRCQARHSGVPSRMYTCSGPPTDAPAGTASSQIRHSSHLPAHKSAAQERGRPTGLGSPPYRSLRRRARAKSFRRMGQRSIYSDYTPSGRYHSATALPSPTPQRKESKTRPTAAMRSSPTARKLFPSLCLSA
jgi:hypothetical protein